MAELWLQLIRVAFLSVVEGETFKGLIEEGRYDFIDPAITAEKFPIREYAGTLRRLVLMSSPRPIDVGDLMEWATGRGMSYPLYEDALRFGQAGDDPPVIFPYESLDGSVLRVDTDSETKRGISKLHAYDQDAETGRPYKYVTFPAWQQFALLVH